jgi:hypothetical protein
MQNSYLTSVLKQFRYYQSLGDKVIDQLTFEELKLEIELDSNSIAIIIKHIVGNMLSRWTNFLEEDGEKSWRNRDDEFIDSYTSKKELIQSWEKGWACLFGAIETLKASDLEKIIYIRNQGHTVTEAIDRQMMHYAYHIGQIVFIGKLTKKDKWILLSIPKGNSESYNSDKFLKDKVKRHFTEDL